MRISHDYLIAKGFEVNYEDVYILDIGVYRLKLKKSILDDYYLVTLQEHQGSKVAEIQLRDVKSVEELSMLLIVLGYEK